MVNKTRLDVSELGQDEIDKILYGNQFGRIAFSLRDRVSIEPISYVYDAENEQRWIYGRTSPGVKLATVRHNEDVAFEVDDVEGLYTWRSVVVHGTFVPLITSDPDLDREAWDRGLSLLRMLDPNILTEDDPAPDRDVLFRIAVEAMTGRSGRLIRD